MADLFRTAGANRLMAIDLHTAQIQGFFDGPVDHLFAMPLLSDYVKERYRGQEFTVVSPDTGRVRMAEQWSDRFGGSPIAFVHKTRDPRVPNRDRGQPRRRRGGRAVRASDRRHDRHRQHDRARRRKCCSRLAPPKSSSRQRTAS